MGSEFCNISIFPAGMQKDKERKGVMFFHDFNQLEIKRKHRKAQLILHNWHSSRGLPSLKISLKMDRSEPIFLSELIKVFLKRPSAQFWRLKNLPHFSVRSCKILINLRWVCFRNGSLQIWRFSSFLLSSSNSLNGFSSCYLEESSFCQLSIQSEKFFTS